MRQFYFDVWPADDIAGTALGELTQAFDRQIRAPDQAIGTGSFAINRHDSQFAWCAQDNMVRVRLVSGGPFAYDDPRYVFAFFIEEGGEVAVSEDEEGGEVVVRGGRDATSILRRAVIYPTNQHADDVRKWAQVPKTGNVVLTNLGPGEAMRVFLRNAVLRSPNPLAPSTHDFNVNTDSSGNDWEDTDTDWTFPVGKDYLTLLSDFVSGGVFFRMGPDLILHCYETHPGVNLSGSITFSKGVDVREAAERQMHASEAMSRAIVRGSRKNNTLQFQEVVDSGIETAIGRREGSVEYKSVSTTARLIRAGRTAIAKAKNHYDGPTTAGILELGGKEPFVDFAPGDSVTLDIPDVYDSVVVRVAAIALVETEGGEFDPIIEFQSSPFDPSTVDGFTETGNTTGTRTGKIDCGDCPEPEPFNPDTESSSAHAVLYFPSEGGTYPPEINFAGTGDTPPAGFPGAPKVGPISYVTGGVTGYPYTALNITGDINGATLELLMSCAGAYAAATVTHTWTIRKNGTAIATASQSRVFGEFPAYWSPSQLLTVTGVSLVNGDTITAELATSGWTGSPPVVPGGIATSEYLRINGTAVVADPTDTPLAGQWVTEQPASDGTTSLLKTNYPYSPYSIEVHVSGVREEVIQTDPTTGEWTLPIVPPAGTQIIVRYQVSSTTSTGATNSYLPSTAPAVVTRVLLGTGSDGSGDNVLHDDGTWHPATSSVSGGSDCCGDDAVPVDRALDATALRLSADDITFIQAATNFEGLAGSVTIDSGDGWDPPVPGDLLVIWVSTRSALLPSTPSDWTAHPGGLVVANNDRGAMFYKVSDGSETSVTVDGDAGGSLIATVAEFSGNMTLTDDAEATGSGTSLASGSVTPTASEPALVVGGVADNTNDNIWSVTPGGSWSEIADSMVDGGGTGGFHPLHWMAYQIIASASGSYNPSGTASATGDWGGQSLAFTGAAGEWNVPAPETVDGDDGTYQQIVGTEILRLDLGASYAIVKARLRLGTATSGSRTYTLKGANEADFSDEVTLDTVTFTATGSYTAQDVEFLWASVGAFRYFQLDGDSETRRIYSLELREQAANELIVTDPSTGEGSDLQAALDDIYAAIGASALDDLTDVTAPTPATGDRLRFDGSVWVNSALNWEPLVDGGGTILLDGSGNILRHEVTY